MHVVMGLYRNGNGVFAVGTEEFETNKLIITLRLCTANMRRNRCSIKKALPCREWCRRLKEDYNYYPSYAYKFDE